MESGGDVCDWGLGGQSRRGLGFDFEPALVAAAVVLVVGVAAAAAAAAFVVVVVVVVFAAAAAVVVVVVFFAALSVAVVGVALLEFVVGSDHFRRREKFARTKMSLGVAAAVAEDLGVVRHLREPFFFSSCSYWSLPLRPVPIASVLWASGREKFHLDLQKAGPVEYPQPALPSLFVPCTSFAHCKYLL